MAPVFALLIPLSAVLLWYTVPRGEWLPVALGVGCVLLLTGAAWLSFRRTAIWIDGDGVTERGFLGGTRHAALDEIDHVTRLELYRGHTLETSSQLFAVRPDGTALLRMRGEFWTPSAMDEVAAALGAPEKHRAEPITIAELRRNDPGLLYWFERRPRRRRPQPG